MIVMCRRCFAYMQKKQGPLLRNECLGARRTRIARDRAAARVAAGKHPDPNVPWRDVLLVGRWVPLDDLVADVGPAVAAPPVLRPPCLWDLDDADGEALTPE